MQSYKKCQHIGKKLLIDFLDFLRFKVENGELTADEIDSLVHNVLKQSDVYATAEELAAFYGQSLQNIRCVVSRKLVKKPRRKVYYPLHEFQEAAPVSWQTRSHGRCGDCT